MATKKDERPELAATRLARLANNAVVAVSAFYAAALEHEITRGDTLEATLAEVISRTSIADLVEGGIAKRAAAEPPPAKPVNESPATPGFTLEQEIVHLATLYVPKPIEWIAKCEKGSPAAKLGEAIAQHFEAGGTDATRRAIVEAAIADVDADRHDTAPITDPRFLKLKAAVEALERKRARAKKKARR